MRSKLVLSLSAALLLSLGLPVTTHAVANPACVPTGTVTGDEVQGPAIDQTYTLHFNDNQGLAYAVATSVVFTFNYSATGNAIPFTTIAGEEGQNTWAGDQAVGTNAKFSSIGGLAKADMSMLYLSASTRVLSMSLTGTYPVTAIAGDGTMTQNLCTEGNGVVAKLNTPIAGQWLHNSNEQVMVIADEQCNRILTIGASSPYTVKIVLGDGTQNNSPGFGASAKITRTVAMAPWRDYFYVTTVTGTSIWTVKPNKNWELSLIVSGAGGQGSSTTDIKITDFNLGFANYGFSVHTWEPLCLLTFNQDWDGRMHMTNPDVTDRLFMMSYGQDQWGGDITTGGAAMAPDGKSIWATAFNWFMGNLAKVTVTYTNCDWLQQTQGECKLGRTHTATMTAQLAPETPTPVTPAPLTPAPVTQTPPTTAPVTAAPLPPVVPPPTNAPLLPSGSLVSSGGSSSDQSSSSHPVQPAGTPLTTVPVVASSSVVQASSTDVVSTTPVSAVDVSSDPKVGAASPFAPSSSGTMAPGSSLTDSPVKATSAPTTDAPQAATSTAQPVSSTSGGTGTSTTPEPVFDQMSSAGAERSTAAKSFVALGLAIVLSLALA